MTPDMHKLAYDLRWLQRTDLSDSLRQQFEEDALASAAEVVKDGANADELFDKLDAAVKGFRYAVAWAEEYVRMRTRGRTAARDDGFTALSAAVREFKEAGKVQDRWSEMSAEERRLSSEKLIWTGRCIVEAATKFVEAKEKEDGHEQG